MVELKKDLPEIFEEFADQRRNSFLAIKKLKEQGVPVALALSQRVLNGCLLHLPPQGAAPCHGRRSGRPVLRIG